MIKTQSNSGLRLLCLILTTFTLFIVMVIADVHADIGEKYNKMCGVCHGNNGDGQGRAGAQFSPKPTNFIAKRGELSREQILEGITNGVKGTAMVGYARRLSAQQIEQMTDYIWTQLMQQADEKVSASQVEGQIDGQEIYERNCAVCHGDTGNTGVWAKNGLNPPPRDFTSSQSRNELTEIRMINSVTHGRPGTAMMSFSGRLTDDEIKTVVKYIRRTFMGFADQVQQQGSISALSMNSDHPDYPNNLRGDADSGREFYQRNCFTCHGKTGEGNGPRAHFNRPAPRNFTSEESRNNFGRLQLFAAIKHGKRGTVMPAWGAVLSDQDIANVAEYVFRAFIENNYPAEKKSPS